MEIDLAVMQARICQRHHGLLRLLPQVSQTCLGRYGSRDNRVAYLLFYQRMA